jgi:hypothetical protein
MIFKAVASCWLQWKSGESAYKGSFGVSGAQKNNLGEGSP